MVVQSISQMARTPNFRYAILLQLIAAGAAFSFGEIATQLRRKTIIVTQTIAFFILVLPLRLFFRIIPTNEIVQTSARNLIVTNHISRLDPFLILAALPYYSFRKLLPIRSFTANVYLNMPVLGILLRALGCFPAYDTPSMPGGIKKALRYSDCGQTLLLFPEGKIRRSDVPIPPRVGVAHLVQKRRFFVRPVHIAAISRSGSRVIWGVPFELSYETGIDLQQLAQNIFEQVLALEHHERK